MSNLNGHNPPAAYLDECREMTTDCCGGLGYFVNLSGDRILCPVCAVGKRLLKNKQKHDEITSKTYTCKKVLCHHCDGRGWIQSPYVLGRIRGETLQCPTCSGLMYVFVEK